MSSPIQQDNEFDDRLSYAPPWARERDSEAMPPLRPRFADSPPTAPQPMQLSEDRPPAADLVPFAGDVAVKELHRRLSLDPEMVPEPPVVERPDSVWPQIGRLILVVGFAATVAFIAVLAVPLLKKPNAENVEPDTTAASSASRLVGAAPSPDRTRAGKSAVRLEVEDRRGVVNHAIGFGVDLKGAAAGTFVTVSGLAVGSRLTAGGPLGTRGWRVSARELDGTAVLSPKDFTGIMDLTIDLHLADGVIADTNVLRLEWVAATAETQSTAEPQLRGAIVPPSAAAEHQLEPDEIVTLLKRGEVFIANGDIAAARLLLRRAAEAGNARAATALGATFDPVALKELGVVGFAPDAAQARAWYQKAAELGSTDASRRLEQLAQAGR